MYRQNWWKWTSVTNEVRDVTDTLWLENNNNPYSVAFWCIRQTMSTVKHWVKKKYWCIHIQTCCTHDSAKLKATDSSYHNRCLELRCKFHYGNIILEERTSDMDNVSLRKKSKLKRTGRNDKITDTPNNTLFSNRALAWLYTEIQWDLKSAKNWNQERGGRNATHHVLELDVENWIITLTLAEPLKRNSK